MNKELEMAERNRIFECVAGSRLYGFATPVSDEDFRGVFIPDKDYVLGMKHIEQVEQKEPDRVLYAVGKFFQLALNSNPNIIEILYVPDEKMIFTTPIWEKVRNNAHLFLSKKARHAFSGYAHSQLHRIKRHKKWLDDKDHEEPKKEDYINQMTLVVGEETQFIQSGWDEIKLIEIISGAEKPNYEDGYYPDEAIIEYFRKDEYEAALRKHKQYLDWKKNRNPDRAKLEEKYQLDTKHATHLIRLLKMGVEILKEGVVHVDREKFGDAQLFKDIRNGKYKYEELLEMANCLEEEIESLYEKSTLQFSPDINGVNNLLMEIYEEFYYGKTFSN